MVLAVHHRDGLALQSFVTMHAFDERLFKESLTDKAHARCEDLNFNPCIGGSCSLALHMRSSAKISP